MGDSTADHSYDQIEPSSGTTSAARLAQQLQQLAVESHATPSRSRSVPSACLAPPQVDASVATQSPQPSSMTQSLHQHWHRDPCQITQSVVATGFLEEGMPHSPAHWTSGVRLLTGSKRSMWTQDKFQHQPQSHDSPEQPIQQQNNQCTRFQDAHDQRSMETQLMGEYEQRMEDLEDDALLDDASLDMLVTTLARETARIESAQQTQKNPHFNHTSVLQYDDNQYEENQRSSEFDYGDDSDFSSTSSNPSTPSTSGSGKSALRVRQQDESKLKPKRVRRACLVVGCGKRSRSLGLCIAHGGGRRCEVNGCDKSSQGGNLCIKHGGGKRCSVEGCEKAAQTNSRCKAHGGGPRCQFGDCEKSSQGGGFCRQHGGGKRCVFTGCMKGTQRGSYCALHGGSRLCIVDGCRRNDRGGGYCAHHGGGRRCSVPGCTQPSRRNSLCSTHLRVLGNDGHNLDELNESIGHGIKRSLAPRTPSPSPPLGIEPSRPTQR